MNPRILDPSTPRYLAFLGVLALAAPTRADPPDPRVGTTPSVSRVAVPGRPVLLFSEDQDPPVVAACVSRIAASDAVAGRLLADGADWRELSDEPSRHAIARGGEALAARVGVVDSRCVRLPASEVAFAMWFLSRQAQLLRSSAQSSSDDSNPALVARRRLAVLARQGIDGTVLDSRLVFTVVGATNAATLASVAEKYLQIPAAPTDPRGALPEETEQSTERLSVLEHAGVAAPVIHHGWRVDRDAAADVAAVLLAGGEASRLHQDLVRRRSRARAVESWLADDASGRMLGVTVAVSARTTVDKVGRFVDGALQQLRFVGPSAAEVRRAVALLSVASLLGLESRLERARALGHAELVLGGAEQLAARSIAYEGVTPEGVRLAMRQLSPSRRSTVEVYPPGWPIDDPALETYRLHTVVKDETWQEVSRRYGVSVTVIARINDLDPKYRLVPGQALWIPPVSPPEGRRPQTRSATGPKASERR